MTIDGSNRPALATEVFTTRFDAPMVIAVERTMTWAAGGPVYGPHSDGGVAVPRTSWLLAEGATGGTFDEFVVVANPNGATANVRVTYLRAEMAPIAKPYAVGARSRLKIWVDKEAPELADTEVAVIVESTNALPVVVERSMLWRAAAAGDWTEAHSSRGSTTMAPRWLVADGEAGGPADASTYVLVANVANVDAPVRVTLLTEAGTTRTIECTVKARGGTR